MKVERALNAVVFAIVCAALAACGGGANGAMSAVAPISAGAPALYGTLTTTPTPAPTGTPQASSSVGCTPSPSPTPTPSKITLQPSSLKFQAVGDIYAQNVTISEPYYTGSYMLDYSSCAGAGGTQYVASAASLNGDLLSNTNPTFEVFPFNAGSCTVVVRDSTGLSASLPVTIAISTPVATPTPAP